MCPHLCHHDLPDVIPGLSDVVSELEVHGGRGVDVPAVAVEDLVVALVGAALPRDKLGQGSAPPRSQPPTLHPGLDRWGEAA